MTTNIKLILAAALFAVPVPVAAQRPPPNWEMTLPGARQWGKDVCSESDSLRSDRACYAAFLRQQVIDRALACNGQVARIRDNDPDLALAPPGTLAQRKEWVAFQRGENCGPDDLIVERAP